MGSEHAFPQSSGVRAMAAKSAETRRVLRELDKELAAASRRLGREIVWSASEQAILGQISSILDRKQDFLEAYEAAEEIKVRLKISAEVRLLEQAAARLVQAVKTDVPAPLSHA
jgi:alpha-beta hydrolase superfamily lysophospholipase